jgi:transcriptional regulator with XRE-family HTH domain
MARALLRLTMKEMAKLSDIDPSTIVRVEAGAKAYSMTLRQIRATLEAEGVYFIDAQEGVHGPGVAFKWGVAPPARQPGEGTATGEDDTGGMKAAWDFEGEETTDADLEALLSEPETLNPDMAEMWRDDPELWARLSEGGRETLSRSMFGDTRAAAADYFGARA